MSPSSYDTTILQAEINTNDPTKFEHALEFCLSPITPAPTCTHKWLTHRTFISNVPHPFPTKKLSTHFLSLISARQEFSEHLTPYGTPLPHINSCRFLRVCMQNTQHDFKIYGDGIEMSSIQSHLLSLGVCLFTPISPNINWKNTANWPRTHHLFRPRFVSIPLIALLVELYKESRGGAPDGPVRKSSADTN
jgi:hypothetical protein